MTAWNMKYNTKIKIAKFHLLGKFVGMLDIDRIFFNILSILHTIWIWMCMLNLIQFWVYFICSFSFAPHTNLHVFNCRHRLSIRLASICIVLHCKCRQYIPIILLLSTDIAFETKTKKKNPRRVRKTKCKWNFDDEMHFKFTMHTMAYLNCFFSDVALVIKILLLHIIFISQWKKWQREISKQRFAFVHLHWKLMDVRPFDASTFYTVLQTALSQLYICYTF